MNTLIPLLATMALLGSALIGGVFFAFSSFVMKALSRVPSSEGIAVMQSINVVVINPSFMAAFMGTVMSLGIAGVALFRWSQPSSSLFLGGAILYLAGTFLVTMLGNVPLNNQLAGVSAAETTADNVWVHYLDCWTMWNHVRTVAATGAALLFTLGLTQSGSM